MQKQKVISIKSEDLTQYVSRENLLKEYGGTLDFDYAAWTQELLQKRTTLSDGKYFNVAGVGVPPADDGEETKKKSSGDTKKSKSGNQKSSGNKKSKSGGETKKEAVEAK